MTAIKRGQLMDATWSCPTCDVKWDGEGVEPGEPDAEFEPVGADDRCPVCGKVGEFWEAHAEPSEGEE